MGTEIERKFLVDRSRLPKRLPKGSKIVQGYLSVWPVVRVRIEDWGCGSEATLTIKGEGTLKRDEFEYEIPIADARKLIKECGFRTVEKIRREIDGWTVDEFRGRNKGLWLAEKEYKSLRAANAVQAAPKGGWLGWHVTEDSEFQNVMLAKTLGTDRFKKPYEQIACESAERMAYNERVEALRRQSNTASSSN